jgi:DNA-binding CsgD family transcriptional regulator
MYCKEEVVVFDSAGEIRRITQPARAWLADYFQIVVETHMPETITQRLSASPRQSLAIVGHDGVLEIEYLPCRRHGQENILLLRTAFTPESCPAANVGLTPREKEVLYWIVKGMTNSEIARLLGNASKTVEKHVGRIYQKLGVENRAAALCRIFG